MWGMILLPRGKFLEGECALVLLFYNGRMVAIGGIEVKGEKADSLGIIAMSSTSRPE